MKKILGLITFIIIISWMEGCKRDISNSKNIYISAVPHIYNFITDTNYAFSFANDEVCPNAFRNSRDARAYENRISKDSVISLIKFGRRLQTDSNYIMCVLNVNNFITLSYGKRSVESAELMFIFENKNNTDLILNTIIYDCLPDSINANTNDVSVLNVINSMVQNPRSASKYFADSIEGRNYLKHNYNSDYYTEKWNNDTLSQIINSIFRQSSHFDEYIYFPAKYRTDYIIYNENSKQGAYFIFRKENDKWKLTNFIISDSNNGIRKDIEYYHCADSLCFSIPFF